jgi:hypothetical protein
MKAYKKIIERLKNERQKIYFIHYSCQSLSDDNEGYSPRITSIAVLHMLSSQMHSFSIHLKAEEMGIARNDIFNNYGVLEMKMLEDFFDFIQKHTENSIWIHWNMTNINYGFEALEHRYKILTKKEPTHVDENNKINISNLFKKRYGSNYAKDPKMLNLMELNGGRDRLFLTGDEEVTAFKAKEFVKLHNSTMCKTYFFREAYGKMIGNKLRTETNQFRYRVTKLYENPIVQILGIIGIIGTIVSLVLLFFNS